MGSIVSLKLKGLRKTLPTEIDFWWNPDYLDILYTLSWFLSSFLFSMCALAGYWGNHHCFYLKFKLLLEGGERIKNFPELKNLCISALLCPVLHLWNVTLTTCCPQKTRLLLCSSKRKKEARLCDRILMTPTSEEQHVEEFRIRKGEAVCCLVKKKQQQLPAET